MSGEELKRILIADGIKLSDLAIALGYKGDQWLHSALNAADVKSGLIERIAAVTKKTFATFIAVRLYVLKEQTSLLAIMPMLRETSKT